MYTPLTQEDGTDAGESSLIIQVAKEKIKIFLAEEQSDDSSIRIYMLLRQKQVVRSTQSCL